MFIGIGWTKHHYVIAGLTPIPFFCCCFFLSFFLFVFCFSCVCVCARARVGMCVCVVVVLFVVCLTLLRFFLGYVSKTHHRSCRTSKHPQMCVTGEFKLQALVYDISRSRAGVSVSDILLVVTFKTSFLISIYDNQDFLIFLKHNAYMDFMYTYK